MEGWHTMKLSLRKKTAIFMGALMIAYTVLVFMLYRHFKTEIFSLENGMTGEQATAILEHYGLLYGIVSILSMLLLYGISIFLLEKYVVSPLTRLSAAADSYKVVKDEIGGLERNDFAQLDIHTGDEIEKLANSMKKMEGELNEQIETLYATRQELVATREEADILNEIANRDALTGIRNKRGYDREIQRINAGIVAGKTEVGIVMVDMNDLKNINDTYGHEKGDKVICSLCDMLCSVFKRSPVFRIGGDEFVVVARNQDFRNLDRNVETFRACIEKSISEADLEPWERVGAAIGYAVYDPDNDIGIEDTLKRADEQMYIRKNAMKSQGD